MAERRSGRERKKPSSIYEDAKKARQKKEIDEQELRIVEEDEEYEDGGDASDESDGEALKTSAGSRKSSKGTPSKKPAGSSAKGRKSATGGVKPKRPRSQAKSSMGVDEHEEEQEDEDAAADIGKKKAPPKKKRAGAKGGGARGKKPSPEELFGEEDESDSGLEGLIAQRKTKPKAARKKAGVSLADLDEGVKSRLFEMVCAGMPVEVLLSKWVEDFAESESKHCAEVFNFLAFSSGASANIVDVEGGLEDYSEAVEALVKDLQEHNTTTYPLVENRGRLKGFRSHFSEVWGQLVRACREGNGHDLHVLRSVIDVVKNMCNASLVAIRHVATCGGLELGSCLVTELLQLAQKAATASRQLEAEQKKGGANSRKAKDLTKNIEQVAKSIDKLEGLLNEITMIFSVRYRDVNERVRVECMDYLGNFLMNYPSMFLKDDFVKYVGWMLYDKSAAVRTSAAQVLTDIYTKEGNLPKLQNFTLRFLKRIQDLVHDVSEDVAERGIAIMRALLNAGYLNDQEQDAMDQVDELLLDATYGPGLRTQAMLFFTDHVDGFNAEPGSNDPKKRRSSSALKDLVAERLKTVVNFLDFHLEDTYAENAQCIETAVRSFEQHPEGDFLYHWPTYFDLLRDDKGIFTSDKGSHKSKSPLSDREHSILIRLLVASVHRAAEHAAEAASKAGKKKPSKPDEKRVKLESALESFTTGAIDDLYKLLGQYQTVPEKVVSLVTLPQYLQRETIENKRNKDAFDTLLKLLKTIYVKATDEEVLSNVSKSLAHLLENDTDRQHNVAVTLQALVQTLLKRLGKQGGAADDDNQGDESDEEDDDGGAKRHSKKKGKRGSERDTLHKDKDFSTGLVLMQLRCLARRIDLSGYVELDDVRSAVVSVVKNYLDIATWPEDEDRLQWTTRVLRESLQLLYLFFVRSTGALLEITRKKYPENAKKADNDDGEGKGEQEEGEEDEDEVEDEELMAEAELVVQQREELVEMLYSVLKLTPEPDVPTSGSSEGSQETRGRRTALAEAARDAKKTAYKISSELRILCRQHFGQYLVLHTLVWTPESDFLRVLQAYFKQEEDRYSDANEDEKEEADAALVNDLLEPMIKSTIYTAESLNRRQAAAIGAHFVDAGKQSSESVRFFMKKLKDMDFKTYLEVLITTLRMSYLKWMARPEGETQDADKFRQLGVRLAQTLGVGKPGKEFIPESFLRFMRAAINFSFEEAPNKLDFLEALPPFLSKVDDRGMEDLRMLMADREQSLTAEVQAQLKAALEQDADPDTLSPELLAYRTFCASLVGSGEGSARAVTKAKGRRSVGGRGRGRGAATSPGPGRGRSPGGAASRAGRGKARGRGRGRGRGGRKMRSYEELEDIISQSDRESRDDEDSSAQEEDDEEPGQVARKRGSAPKPSGRPSRGRTGRPSTAASSRRGSSLSSQLGTLQELGESDDRDEDHDEEDTRAQKKRGRPSQQEPEDDDDSEGDFSSAKGKVRRKGSPAPGARKRASQHEPDEDVDHDSLFGELTTRAVGANKKARK